MGAGMGDPQLHRVLASLEATFDAAVAREEEEAAADLALSLSQDRSLPESLLGSGPVQVVLDGGGTAPVSAIGDDYVAAGSLVRLFRSQTATFVVGGDGDAPRRTPTSLLSVLRRCARFRDRVTVCLNGGVFNGRLVSAAPDHIVLDGAAGRFVIGVGAMREIRLVTEGSFDGL
jgi:hypothetical protein